jgi:hypothetical protein
MGKLIIDPKTLAEIRAALAAKELEEKKAQEPEAAAEELPTRVREFWEHQEPDTPWCRRRRPAWAADLGAGRKSLIAKSVFQLPPK